MPACARPAAAAAAAAAQAAPRQRWGRRGPRGSARLGWAPPGDGGEGRGRSSGSAARGGYGGGSGGRARSFAGNATGPLLTGAATFNPSLKGFAARQSSAAPAKQICPVPPPSTSSGRFPFLGAPALPIPMCPAVSPR